MVSAVVVGVGCSSSDSDASSAPIVFDGHAAPLPGFSYDTGLLPPASPAQASFKVAADGDVHVTASGLASGAKLVPKAGSGSLTLDVKFVLAGHLKVDSTLKSYDGDIPGLQNVVIAAHGEIPFDPFLLDGTPADVTAPIPATQLPDIPLGSVPGTLKLAIGDGSSLKTSFQGTCLGVHGGSASYQGKATTSGTLVLDATIALDLPAPLDKSVPLPPITVAVPSTSQAVDLGTQPASGVDDADQGECAGADGGADDGGNTSDAKTSKDGGDGVDCTMLANTAPLITFAYSPDALPGASGGSVTDGTYYLTSKTFYENPGTGGSSDQATVEISGGGRRMRMTTAVFAQNQTVQVAQNGTITASGTSFTEDSTACGVNRSTFSYTANAFGLTLIDPSVKLVYVYTKQ